MRDRRQKVDQITKLDWLDIFASDAVASAYFDAYFAMGGSDWQAELIRLRKVLSDKGRMICGVIDIDDGNSVTLALKDASNDLDD